MNRDKPARRDKSDGEIVNLRQGHEPLLGTRSGSFVSNPRDTRDSVAMLRSVQDFETARACGIVISTFLSII
jgi:hypothetical protein